MKNRSVRKCLTAAALLAAGLSASQTSAEWYMNQSEGYYKPQVYHNEKYGDFPPADIDEKLFEHLNTEARAEESKPPAAAAPATAYSTQSAPLSVPQASNPAQYSQQPAYGRYNQNRNNAPAGNQRRSRNTNFNGPRNNSRSGFSGPWNNNGSSFSGPWNNNGSSFGGPWNSNGSNFSGPWNNNGNNNGSSFSMPWGNNNRSGSGFNPMGNGGSWGW